jgi:hypothetical protein
MTFVRNKSKTTDATSGAGTAYPSGAPELAPSIFTLLSGVCVIFVVKANVLICFVGVYVLFTLFCIKLRIFPYQMMFVTLNSNATGVTSGVGTDNISEVLEFIPGT